MIQYPPPLLLLFPLVLLFDGRLAQGFQGLLVEVIAFFVRGLYGLLRFSSYMGRAFFDDFVEAGWHVSSHVSAARKGLRCHRMLVRFLLHLVARGFEAAGSPVHDLVGERVLCNTLCHGPITCLKHSSPRTIGSGGSRALLVRRLVRVNLSVRKRGVIHSSRRFSWLFQEHIIKLLHGQERLRVISVHGGAGRHLLVREEVRRDLPLPRPRLLLGRLLLPHRLLLTKRFELLRNSKAAPRLPNLYVG